LIYDYSGFPPHTYQLTYPAPGSPKLAEQIRELLSGAGIAARTDSTRGFDHGVFIPFKVAYPEAQIPIVQLSLHTGLDPSVHLAVGRALQPLRDEGILITGSGMSYHNIRGFFSGSPIPASDQFDAWLTDVVTTDAQKRNAGLQQWQTAPSARDAHPREEHLIPLMVAAGAAGDDKGERVFSDRVMGATISAYRFG
jgi:aromatic ring-opening dioxygenase catalytic subunit (LigB family)